MKIIITNQPESNIQEVEYVSSKSKRTKFKRDIDKLIEQNKAKFHGRSLNDTNNRVYRIYSIGEKRVLMEDLEATEIVSTLFDDDGQLRKFEVKK